MRVTLCAGLSLGVLLCAVISGAEPVQQCQRSRLAANIELTPDLDRVLVGLYDRSPTFKAQCERLAAAGNLRVIVRLDTSLPSHYRAITRFWRHGREIRANVHVPPGHRLIELLAHEFEHVIEQVEGLNLRVLARKRGSGVYELDGALFESDRARRAGRDVADEAWRAKAPSAD